MVTNIACARNQHRVNSRQRKARRWGGRWHFELRAVRNDREDRGGGLNGICTTGRGTWIAESATATCHAAVGLISTANACAATRAIVQLAIVWQRSILSLHVAAVCYLLHTWYQQHQIIAVSIA